MGANRAREIGQASCGRIGFPLVLIASSFLSWKFIIDITFSVPGVEREASETPFLFLACISARAPRSQRPEVLKRREHC